MRHVESSENITIMDEIDELLGTRRSYGWNSGSRPSMISAKYRLKEERRKVLKISVNKMKKIDDAESSLCRSVLINNTVKRLQAETRDDRTTGRTSPASPPSPTSYGYHSPQQQSCGGSLNNNSNINNNNNHNPQLVDITNLRESPLSLGGKSNIAAANKPVDGHSLDPTSTTTTSSTGVSYPYDDDDTITSIMMQLPSTATATATTTTNTPPAASSQTPKRKRSVDEPLDDLLSQFINNSGGQREDEDVNVVDLDLHEYPAAKRLRTDEAAAAAAAASNSGVAAAATDLCSSDCWTLMDSCCDALDLYGGQVPAAVEHQDVLLPAAVVTAAAAAAAAAAANNCNQTSSADCGQPSSQMQTDADHYGTGSGSTSPTNLSCGQASMFSEMQSAMFRNLIASLES